MHLIDFTKLEDSYFDIIIIKARRREAKEQTQLRYDKDSKTDNEEVSLL